MLQSFSNALKGDPKALEWPPATATAFPVAKGALAAAVPLAHPAPNSVLSLAMDASNTHVGGILQQLAKGSWQPLAFYSNKLSGAGTRYSTLDIELLAAFSAVRHFRSLLEGLHFCLLRPQTPGPSPVPHHATLVCLPTVTIVFHRRIYFRHQTHARTGERGQGCPEPPTPAETQPKTTPQPTSFTTVTEDWPKERLAAYSFGSHHRCAISGLFGDGRTTAILP
jgi:hypothetical protein